MKLRRQIADVLAQRKHNTINDPGLVQAAVLLPLFEKGREPHLLFTKRTQTVATHKGQISFPGGAKDEEDVSLEFTALRETFEEVGVRFQDVEVLGRLDDITTHISNFVVSPFVAAIPYPYEFNICKAETEYLLEVPVPALLDRSCFTEDAIVRNGLVEPVYFYQYQGNLIWGATARILTQFLDSVFVRNAERPPAII
ncbi:MAG: CoA pyrophosphatase [Dehalococcoidia bacterium]|nr:CoA pyrophosphatase [Dehalococcoidia bacterium]